MATTSTKAPKAPAAPAAPAAPVAPSTSNALLAAVYKVGKPYNVRPNTAQNNAASWQVLLNTITANGGSATRAQLVAALAPLNHAPMVGYAIRRGWLAPA